MTMNKVHDMQGKAYHDIPGISFSDRLKNNPDVTRRNIPCGFNERQDIPEVGDGIFIDAMSNKYCMEGVKDPDECVGNNIFTGSIDRPQYSNLLAG